MNVTSYGLDSGMNRPIPYWPAWSQFSRSRPRELTWCQGKSPNNSSWCPNLHVCYSNMSMFSSTINYYHTSIHPSIYILSVQSKSGTVETWLHKRRKTSATTGLPKGPNQGHAASASIPPSPGIAMPWDEGGTLLLTLGVASQLVNGS